MTRPNVTLKTEAAGAVASTDLLGGLWRLVAEWRRQGGWPLAENSPMVKCAAELEAVIWLAECDLGLHSLSPEDEKALDASRPKLMEDIRRILSSPNDGVMRTPETAATK